MFGLITRIGARSIRFFDQLGKFAIMVYRILTSLLEFSTYGRLSIEQMVAIGVTSLPIVIYLSIFAGMVTSVQASYQMEKYIPLYIIGSVVSKSILLELAPMLTALVLSGRVGATIAAELGTMRVTEQIDALESMGFNSVAYLVVPRVIAGVVMFPVLTVFSAAVGIAGGWFICLVSIGLSTEQFAKGVQLYFNPFDLTYCMIKSACFGLTICLVACQQGTHVAGGARGVGAATTNAVVIACLLILMQDYFLAQILL